MDAALHHALSTPANLEHLWTTLHTLDVPIQARYMTKLARVVNTLDAEMADRFISESYKNYVYGTVERGEPFKAVFLTAHLAQRHPHVVQSHEDFFVALVKKLHAEPRLANFLYAKVQKGLGVSANIMPIAPRVPSRSLSVNGRAHFTAMQKFLWMDYKMRRSSQDFVSQFSLLVDNLAYELVRTAIVGVVWAEYNNSEPYVQHNWRNFLVATVPYIVSNELGVELDVDVLDESGFAPDVYQVFREKHFLVAKSLVLNGAVSSDAWARWNVVGNLQAEKASFSADLHLHARFSETLLQPNPEFVSLAESGLVEFMNRLPDDLELSHARQIDFATVVEGIIKGFMESNDSERLHRLLVVLLNNMRLCNVLVAQMTPSKLVTLLVDYVDTHTFSDSDDFQDSYSHFGVVLLGIVLISTQFGLDLSVYHVRGSFALDYVNSFYYRLGDTLRGTIDHDTSLDLSLYNNLTNEWINALFDDANDGLSDDLIRSAPIKHVYKMIPLVYKQAVAAAAAKTITYETLATGIDYLSQSFLVPCTLSIVSWLLRKTTGGDIYARVLEEIVKSNAGELGDMDDDSADPSRLVFRIVLQICGDRFASVFGPETPVGAFVRRSIDQRYSWVPTHAANPEKCFREYLVKGPRKGVPHCSDVFANDTERLEGLMRRLKKENSDEAVVASRVASYFASLNKKESKECEMGKVDDGFVWGIEDHFASIFEEGERGVIDWGWWSVSKSVSKSVSEAN